MVRQSKMKITASQNKLVDGEPGVPGGRLTWSVLVLYPPPSPISAKIFRNNDLISKYSKIRTYTQKER
jgi:hypothetical protein